MSGPALSGEQILDEVGQLAAIEHSLLVEYLSVHCALGHDFTTEMSTPTSERVEAAARAAFRKARREMRHLRNLNGVLTGAGRSPETRPGLEELELLEPLSPAEYLRATPRSPATSPSCTRRASGRPTASRAARQRRPL